MSAGRAAQKSRKYLIFYTLHTISGLLEKGVSHDHRFSNITVSLSVQSAQSLWAVSKVVSNFVIPWTTWNAWSVSLCLASICTPRSNLLFHVSLDFQLLHSNPLWWKWHFFVCVCVLVLCLVVLQRTNQLELLWHQWLVYRLGLL